MVGAGGLPAGPLGSPQDGFLALGACREEALGLVLAVPVLGAHDEDGGGRLPGNQGGALRE